MTGYVDHSVNDAGSAKMTPTLSVALLNYNYGRYLCQCLDSILKQTWKDFEIILINDCSTDNSLQVIEPYLRDLRIRLVNHEQNRGFIWSLREGADLAQGKYLMHMSADDFCISDSAFETLLQMMEADAETAFAYSAYQTCDDDGAFTWLSKPLESSCVRAGADEYRDLLLNNNHVMHSGTIMRKTAYTAVDGWDLTARHSCDSVMWLMLCGQGKVAYCADELYAYRKHGSNMSVSVSGIHQWVRDENYGITKSFEIMRGKAGVSEDLRVRGLKRGLSGPSMNHAFSGSPRLAWYAYWCALRINPMLTVFQSRTLILIARTLLGHRGFYALRSLLRSLLKRERPDLAPA
jgi:glycosyltransferase involved in cell wall biosynthesis